MRARTAEKLIWKLTPMACAGAISSSIAIASASPRSDSARRPTTMPSVTTQAMAKLRMIGTCAPVSSM